MTDTKDNPKEIEARVEAWKDYVRKDMNALLDKFLDVSDRAATNVSYINPVKQRFEGGEAAVQYDSSKATGVQLSFVFRFEEPIDVPTETE